jgi:hypothetical protein
VQSKFVFSAILNVLPNGIMSVDADENLLRQNERITVDALRWYGKLLTLLKEIRECIVLLDGPFPIGYMKGGGIVFDNFLCLSVDEFDLDNGWPPFSRWTEMYFDREGQPLSKDIPPLNPALKWVVNNYCFVGNPSTFFAQHLPTIVVGPAMAELIRSCPQNPYYMQHCVTADRLDEAVHFAVRTSGTPNVLVFDGAEGGFNLTAPLVDFLKARAAEVENEVEKVLLPKWCRQRNLDEVMQIENCKLQNEK